MNLDKKAFKSSAIKEANFGITDAALMGAGAYSGKKIYDSFLKDKIEGFKQERDVKSRIEQENGMRAFMDGTLQKNMDKYIEGKAKSKALEHVVSNGYINGPEDLRKVLNSL